MNNFENEFNENKNAWNLKTPVHVNSDFYDMESFRSGKTSLRHIELDELGNIQDKSLLHLQCHFGQDTLSLARLGAEVTGIDFSETAIDKAKKLSTELNIPADFFCSNVYNTGNYISRQFDIVFTSYGVIGWLPDLANWAKVIKDSLKTGGIFYIVEFHPFIWMMDDNFERFEFSYFHSEKPLEFDVKGTYTDREAKISYKNYNWIHSISDIFTALKNNGLEIEFFHEFPYSVYNCFPNMEKISGQKWVFKNHGDKIPYLFSLKARKK